MDSVDPPHVQTATEPAPTTGAPQILQETITLFQNKPGISGAHNTAQRAYNKFCANRTAQLYITFWELVGAPDFSGTGFNPKFTARVPTGGSKDNRPVQGMELGGLCHGVVRYEYKANIIEECHMQGAEHGLRVVFTEVGQIWVRLYSNGERLAQIVLNGDYSVASMPKPIDDGGLKMLRNHLHLIVDCFKAK